MIAIGKSIKAFEYVLIFKLNFFLITTRDLQVRKRIMIALIKIILFDSQFYPKYIPACTYIIQN